MCSSVYLAHGKAQRTIVTAMIVRNAIIIRSLSIISVIGLNAKIINSYFKCSGAGQS